MNSRSLRSLFLRFVLCFAANGFVACGAQTTADSMTDASTAPPVSAVHDLGSVSTSQTIYADSLSPAFADWSWATHTMEETRVVHSGKDAISLQANNWQGLLFVTSTPWTASQYSTLDFWIYGSSNGGEVLLASLYYADGTASTLVDISTYIAGGQLVANTWEHVQVPFTAMGATQANITGITLQGGVSGSQSLVYIDDITLTPAAPASTTGTSSTAGTTNPTTSTGTTAATGGGAATASGGTGSGVPTTPVYSDALASGFSDWSWATHSLSETTVVHSGKDAISINPNAYQGVMFVSSAPWSSTAFSAFDFWVYPTASGEQLLASLYYANGSGSTQVNVGSLITGGTLPANVWTHVTVPFSAMSADGNITGVVIQGGVSGNQAVVYIDDISLDVAGNAAVSTTGGSAPATVAPVAWPAVVFGDNPGGNDPNAVALTFDDGPDGSAGGENNTGYVLDQLKALGLHATFFVCGHLWTDVTTDTVAQADLRRMVSEGHDIGSHTLNHPYLDTLTPSAVAQEFSQNLAAFQNPNVLGASFAMSMYRAPFGVPYQENNPNVTWVATETQPFGVHVGWGIDSDDWKCAQNAQDVNCIINNVRYQLNQGHSGVILMHAVYKLTGDALPAVVQAIYQRGYHIVQVQDFIKAKYGATSAQLLASNKNASFPSAQVSTAAVNMCAANDFNIDPPY